MEFTVAFPFGNKLFVVRSMAAWGVAALSKDSAPIASGRVASAYVAASTDTNQSVGAPRWFDSGYLHSLRAALAGFSQSARHAQPSTGIANGAHIT